MKLRVRNFGHVRKADVEIKPLTVFVGPSNTGKSYLAMLLYSIVKTLSALSGADVFTHFDKARRATRSKSWAEIANNSRRFRSIVAKAMPVFANMFRNAWIAEAKRCFGKEWDNIVKQNGKLPTSLSIVYDDGGVLDLLDPKNDKFPDTTKAVNYVKKEMKETDMSGFSISITVRGEELLDSGGIWICAQGLSNFLMSALRGGDGLINSRSHYLPASRGGIMQSHRTLTSTVIEKAPEAGLTGSKPIIPFTGVVGDFLKKLMLIGDKDSLARSRARSLRHRTPSKESSKDIGEKGTLPRQMEEDILHGEILVKLSETGYPEDFRYRFVDTSDRKREIPLMSASSSVSELAPIALFMRYHLFPGDVFIVEEPEAHLHPKAQRKTAGVLVGVVNADVHVVVTTHSDIILEQLSNFVHAHGASKAKVLGKGSDGRTISPDRVAVYSFADSSLRKGTDVREVKFDDDTGMVTQDHLDEAADIYNEFVGIADAQEDD